MVSLISCINSITVGGWGPKEGPLPGVFRVTVTCPVMSCDVMEFHKSQKTGSEEICRSFPKFSKHLVRRYVDPKNLPKKTF